MRKSPLEIDGYVIEISCRYILTPKIKEDTKDLIKTKLKLKPKETVGDARVRFLYASSLEEVQTTLQKYYDELEGSIKNDFHFLSSKDDEDGVKKLVDVLSNQEVELLDTIIFEVFTTNMYALPSDNEIIDSYFGKKYTLTQRTIDQIGTIILAWNLQWSKAIENSRGGTFAVGEYLEDSNSTYELDPFVKKD